MSETLGKWQVGQMLGEGGFSQVRLGTHVSTGELAALKILNKTGGGSKQKSELKQVETEIDSMKKIQHKNVLEMKDFSMDLKWKGKPIILLVLELASGGELFEYLSMCGAFSEIVARTYFHQLMGGLKSAHDVGICHRDLKPENLLMDDDFQLKIADFGFAHTMHSGKLYTECGTRGYMAPEMFGGKGKGYDGKKVDIWAAGVVLFIMKTGFPPYQVPSRSDWWWNKLMHKKYDRFWMAHERSATVSKEFKDLINKMFSYNPDDRISMEGILDHDWYKGDILDASKLKKELAAKKAIIDEKNGKLREQKEEEQITMGYTAGKVRAIGDEEEEGEPDYSEADSDELPKSGPQSIILAMKEEDKDDNDDDDDLQDDDGMSGGMDGVTLGDTGDEKKEEEAQVYAPPKMNYTKFECSTTPEDTYEALKETLDKFNVSYKTEGYAFRAQITTLSGSNLTFSTEVFKHPKDSNISIVECTRGKGDPGAYRNFYAKIRNTMDSCAREATES